MLTQICKNYSYVPAQDVYRIYEFMKQMNGWLSYITTLALFVFIGNLIACKFQFMNSKTSISFLFTLHNIIYMIAYLDLTHNTRKEDHINIAVGFCNVIQWLLAASFPIIMVRPIESHIVFLHWCVS